MSSKFFAVKAHILPGQYIREYPGATLDSQEDDLSLHIKQYTPLERELNCSERITVIGTHANGFPKELYEPLWDEVYFQAKACGISIGSIWIADVVQQGQSSVLNEDKLGSDLLIDPVFQLNPVAPGEGSHSNYARLSTFRRDLWPSRSAAADSFRKSPFYKTWDPRVLSLWNRFALRELPTALYPESPTPTRKPESNETKTKSASIPERPVTLTTTKHQEVFTFLRPNFPTPGQPILNRYTHPDLDPSVPAESLYPFYRPESAFTFRRLPNLRPSVLYIFGGSSDISPPQWRKDKLEATGNGVGGSGGLKEGRVKGVTLDDVGHLIPMVVPKLCAEKAVEWLVPEMGRWREQEDKWTREWKAAGRGERQVVSEEYKEKIGGGQRSKTTSEKL
ncbi:MAG: hypothetical protein Q9195_003872 [Heterodermia aff. obscurata]